MSNEIKAAPRCTFRYVDSGVFRQCEAAPAPGHERCEAHEDQMARMEVSVKCRADLAASLAAGTTSVEEHAEQLRVVHEWEQAGGTRA